MPIDPATPFPLDPMARVFAELADLKRKVAALERNGLTRPSAYAITTAAQALNAGIGWNPIAFNTQVRDSDNIFDPAVLNTRFTCRTPGLYVAIGTVAVDPGTTGNRIGAWQMNGTTWASINTSLPSAVSTWITPVALVPMAVGDYLEMMAYVDVAGLNTIAAYTRAGVALVA